MGVPAAALSIATEMGPQLANMALLYIAISLLNRRSRKHGDTAARQVRQQRTPAHAATATLHRQQAASSSSGWRGRQPLAPHSELERAHAQRCSRLHALCL